MSVLQAVDALVGQLESSGSSYAIIGGVAILLHGGRASTIDFDIYVVAADLPKLRGALIAAGAASELQAAHQERFDFRGLKVDVLEADEIMAADLFKRCARKKLVAAEANVASIEDLIVLKTLADRPVDRRDVEELREIFAASVDESYVARKLKEFD